MFEVPNEVRTSLITAYYASRRDENVQVCGFVIIIDMTGYGAKHLTHWTMDDMKKWNSFWQAGFLMLLVFIKKMSVLSVVAHVGYMLAPGWSLWLIGTVRAEPETVISRAWVQSPDPAE